MAEKMYIVVVGDGSKDRGGETVPFVGDLSDTLAASLATINRTYLYLLKEMIEGDYDGERHPASHISVEIKQGVFRLFLKEEMVAEHWIQEVSPLAAIPLPDVSEWLGKNNPSDSVNPASVQTGLL